MIAQTRRTQRTYQFRTGYAGDRRFRRALAKPRRLLSFAGMRPNLKPRFMRGHEGALPLLSVSGPRYSQSAGGGAINARVALGVAFIDVLEEGGAFLLIKFRRVGAW